MYNAEKHFETLYATVPRKYEFEETSREGLVAWQANFRPELREALGLDNMESDLAGYVSEGGATGSLGYGRSYSGKLVFVGGTDSAFTVLFVATKNN